MDLCTSALNELSVDMWEVVFYYLNDFRDVIRAWISFGLQSKISRSDGLWFRYVYYLFQSEGDARRSLHRAMIRLGYSSLAEQDRFWTFIRDMYLTTRCCRSGCFKSFREIDNKRHSCRYHPGRLSTCLSCCGQKSFESIGCKTDYHDRTFQTFPLSSEIDLRMIAPS